jgi:hypothetical protein
MHTRIAALLLVSAAPFATAAGLPQGAYTLGDYTMTLADHGKLTLKEKDNVVLNGTWVSKDAKFTITDVSGSYACAAPNATGVYGWKADGESVTFAKEKDGCDDRAQALDGKTWKRKS